MVRFCKYPVFFPAYVMRSSEMSLVLGTIKLWICSLFGKATRKLCFAENLIRIGLNIPKILQRQFCSAENNKLQKQFLTIMGYISKSISLTYDSFRLIISHMDVMCHLILVDELYTVYIYICYIYSLYSFEIRCDVTSGRLRISGSHSIWNRGKMHVLWLLAVKYTIYHG